MTILKITNLTATPREDILARTIEMIAEYEERNNVKLTEEQKDACHESIDDIIEDFEENGKVSDALSFVDNLIVNFDYYAHVKETVENFK